MDDKVVRVSERDRGRRPHRVARLEPSSLRGRPAAWTRRGVPGCSRARCQACQPVLTQSPQPDVLKYPSDFETFTIAVPDTLSFARIESMPWLASFERSQ